MASRNELLGQIHREDLARPEEPEVEKPAFPPTWRYHPIEGPLPYRGKQCFTREEVEELEGRGWVDTPAKFKDFNSPEARQKIIENMWEEDDDHVEESSPAEDLEPSKKKYISQMNKTELIQEALKYDLYIDPDELDRATIIRMIKKKVKEIQK